MAFALLAFALALAFTRGASAAGTVLALYNFTNGPSIKNAPVTAWVALNVFAPTNQPGIGGPCFNLPFSPKSGLISWNAAAGTEVCRYVIFYLNANCVPRGNDPVVKYPSKGSSSSFPDFSKASPAILQQIPNAQSIGCSFTPDPCAVYGCTVDPNAQCISNAMWILDTSDPKKPSGTLVPAYTNLNCDQCKLGYTKVNGKCSDICSSLTCPPGSTCQAVNGTGACVCPGNFEYDAASGTCVSSVADAWLAPINALRAPSNTSDVSWNSTIASLASSWAVTLSSQCIAVLTGQTALVSKLPNSGLSENDAFLAYSSDEADVITLWAPTPDIVNARVARLVSSKVNQVGCAKVLCGVGVFAVCLFSPYIG
jgi:hypothetical protein